MGNARNYLLLIASCMFFDTACLITITNKTSYEIQWQLEQKRTDGKKNLKPLRGSTKPQAKSEVSLNYAFTNAAFIWIEPVAGKMVIHPIAEYPIKEELSGDNWLFAVDTESVCGSVAEDTAYIKDMCMPGDAKQEQAPPPAQEQEKKQEPEAPKKEEQEKEQKKKEEVKKKNAEEKTKKEEGEKQ